MIRSIKYDSICKIIVLCCNFLPFSSFLLKHILNNANVMNVLCFYKKKKKRLRENTIIEEITTFNVTVMQHRDLASFLLCALSALRSFCSAPFFPAPFLFCALFVAPLLSAPFLPCPNVLFCQMVYVLAHKRSRLYTINSCFKA